MNSSLSIAFFMHMPLKGFSGGRYHAVMLAVGLAECGHSVTIVTNNENKEFFEIINTCTHQLNILFETDSAINSIKPELVIIVPGGDKNLVLSKAGYRLAAGTGATSCFLNFETPNWWMETFNYKGPYRDWREWIEAQDKADIILSTTKIGMRYAEKFFPHPVHLQAYAPINVNILNSVLNKNEKQKSHNSKKIISVFSRFGRYHFHKRAVEIGRLAHPLLADYKIVFVGSTGDHMKFEFIQTLELFFSQYNIEIEFKYDLSEEQKYLLIHQSQFCFYPTLFEGFGYPPVESQAMGKPVLMPALPVLKEVHKKGHFYDSRKLKSFEKALEKTVKSKSIAEKQRLEYVSKFAPANIAQTFINDVRPHIREPSQKNKHLPIHIYIIVLRLILKHKVLQKFTVKPFKLLQRLMKR